MFKVYQTPTSGMACCIILIASVAPSIARAECPPCWGGGIGYPGVDGDVYAITTFDDGSGLALFVGGAFDIAGGITANGIAKWNGSSWSALGSGIDGNVFTLTVFDDGGGPALYAGGFFTTAGGVSANCIAKWDGSSWSALGSGMVRDVRKLVVFDDGSGPALYAGGFFTSAGGVSANRIAKWDGSSWSPLGSGFNNNMVLALAEFDDGTGPALYAGGSFSNGFIPGPNRIAKWDGSSWTSLGTGMDKPVNALSVFDDGDGPALYAGGDFTTAGGTSANLIAKWNGSNWAPVGTGVNNRINVLNVFDDGNGPALYVGGLLNQAGGVSANGIAKWNGTDWSSLGSGISNPTEEGDQSYVVSALDNDGQALYAGGIFKSAGGASQKNIAQWGTGRPGTPAILPEYIEINKTRFISFHVASGANISAVRVKFVSLHHVDPPYRGEPSVPFKGFEGQERWVGPPAQYVESTATGTPWFAASLQCTPHYRDWSSVGLLHVTGSGIVPSSTYIVESLAASCQGNEAGCTYVSAPVTINTIRWGDVEEPFSPSSPGQPNFGDLATLLNKFRSAPGAAIKARMLLAGDDASGNFSTNTMSFDLSFSHIAACVDAFRGEAYPYAIQSCP